MTDKQDDDNRHIEAHLNVHRMIAEQARAQRWAYQLTARDRIIRLWVLIGVSAALCAAIFLIFAAIQRAHGAESPLWVATTKADCGGYTAVLWTGMAQKGQEAPASFWRIYNVENLCKAKGPRPCQVSQYFKEADGELYFRGKKCEIAE